MKVVLFDRKELVIDKQQADKLVKSLARDDKGIVQINGFTIKKSAIAYIQPGGITEADKPKLIPENKRIAQPTASQETIDKIRKRLVRKGIIKSS